MTNSSEHIGREDSGQFAFKFFGHACDPALMPVRRTEASTTLWFAEPKRGNDGGGSTVAWPRHGTFVGGI